MSRASRSASNCLLKKLIDSRERREVQLDSCSQLLHFLRQLEHKALVRRAERKAANVAQRQVVRD